MTTENTSINIDVPRVVSVLDAIIPWAVRGANEHPFNAGFGHRAIGRASALRKELTGENAETPDAAVLEQTQMDRLQMEAESNSEWIAGILYLGRQMLNCRQAGQDDEALYRKLETFINNPPN